MAASALGRLWLVVGVSNQTPANGALCRGVLVVALRGQRVPFRRNHLPTATKATINARVRRDRARGCCAVKGVRFVLVHILRVFLGSHGLTDLQTHVGVR